MSQDASTGDAEPPERSESAEPSPPARFDCNGPDPGARAAGIEAARQAVDAGECIVLPTDTVYGIGADAFSAEAVQRLLDAKHRGRDMPPPVLLGDASLIQALATNVPEAARRLVAVHWPGALTIICRIQPSLRMDLGDTEGTIALRVPDHDLAREILRRTGPLAVSSANLSGRPAASTCDQALDQLGDRVSVYLDGDASGAGEAQTGLPSTIVDFTVHPEGEIRRRGVLELEVLRATVPELRDFEAAEPAEAATENDGQVSAEPVGAVPPNLETDDDSFDPAPDFYDPDADPDQPGLFDDEGNGPQSPSSTRTQGPGD